MRAAPLSSIAAAVNNKPSTCKFLPVLDGAFIQDYPSRALARGAFHHIPFLGGQCTDDGSIFVGSPATFVNTTDGFVAALRKRYTTMVRVIAYPCFEGASMLMQRCADAVKRDRGPDDCALPRRRVPVDVRASEDRFRGYHFHLPVRAHMSSPAPS